MTRLTKNEISALKSIAEKQGIIGKKHLENFIWCNTTEAKYEIGDKVVFTRRDQRIYGNPLIDWVGTVVKRTWVTGTEKCISYELEVTYEVNGVTKQTKSYVAESDISKKNNRLKGINKVSVKSEHEESLHI
jgi:hypothetical protein